MKPENCPEKEVGGGGFAEPSPLNENSDSPHLVEHDSLLPALTTLDSDAPTETVRPLSLEEQRKAERDAYWNQRIDINYQKTGTPFFPSNTSAATANRIVRIAQAVAATFVITVLSMHLLCLVAQRFAGRR